MNDFGGSTTLPRPRHKQITAGNRTNAARLFFALWYLLGSLSHVFHGITNNHIYEIFGRTAIFAVSRELWGSVVMPHITVFALLLAVFEMSTGILILSKGRPAWIGLVPREPLQGNAAPQGLKILAVSPSDWAENGGHRGISKSDSIFLQALPYLAGEELRCSRRFKRHSAIAPRPSTEVRVEEGSDTAPRIHGGGFVKCDSSEPKQLKPELPFVVHERMSGFRVFFDIMWNESTSQCALQLIGSTLLPAALATVASDNGARRLRNASTSRGSLPP